MKPSWSDSSITFPTEFRTVYHSDAVRTFSSLFCHLLPSDIGCCPHDSPVCLRGLFSPAYLYINIEYIIKEISVIEKEELRFIIIPSSS